MAAPVSPVTVPELEARAEAEKLVRDWHNSPASDGGTYFPPLVAAIQLALRARLSQPQDECRCGAPGCRGWPCPAANEGLQASQPQDAPPVRDELIRLAEAWVRVALARSAAGGMVAAGEDDPGIERQWLQFKVEEREAETAFRAYVDTLQPDGRVMVPRDSLAMLRGCCEAARTILRRQGHSTETIDQALAATAALQSDTATIAASPRKDPTALTPQTTGEKDKL